MRNALIRKLDSSPVYLRAFYWGKLLTITGGAQIIIQLVGLVSGILIIRILPTSEYALYTLANTMLGTMTILADGGIATGVMSEGGKVWQDKFKLGVVLSTGMDLRKKFAIGSLAIAVPILFFLFRHHDVSLLMSFLLIISLIPAFITALSGTILEVAPKLQQDIAPLQKIQLFSSIGRVMLLTVSVVIFPFAFLALIASSIPQIWSNVVMRKISLQYASKGQLPDPEVRKSILESVKRILPLSIYYCFSSQITVFLLSIFGSTTSIAQIGALGRLSMMLNIINVLFGVLIIPRFSRMPPDRKLLLKWYLIVHVFMVIFSASLLSLVWLFPEQVLWILGKQYSGLTEEVFLNFAACCLSLIAGIGFSLYSHRGWVMKTIPGISIGLGGIILGIFLFDFSTLKGILLFNLFVSAISVIVNFSHGVRKILQS
jgi:O-antigen/teichoic acid export membrane protein